MIINKHKIPQGKNLSQRIPSADCKRMMKTKEIIKSGCQSQSLIGTKYIRKYKEATTILYLNLRTTELKQQISTVTFKLKILLTKSLI